VRGQGVDLLAGGIEKAVAERGGHAGTAVVGGAAADADQHAAGAAGEGVGEHLARAAGRRLGGLERQVEHLGQAAGGTHFQHRLLRLGQPAVAGAAWAPAGVDHRAFHPVATECGDHRLGGAFTAVGDRAEVEFGARQGLAQAFLQDRRHLTGAEGSLEFVAGDEDAHAHGVGRARHGVKAGRATRTYPLTWHPAVR